MTFWKRIKQKPTCWLVVHMTVWFANKRNIRRPLSDKGAFQVVSRTIPRNKSSANVSLLVRAWRAPSNPTTTNIANIIMQDDDRNNAERSANATSPIPGATLVHTPTASSASPSSASWLGAWGGDWAATATATLSSLVTCHDCSESERAFMDSDDNAVPADMSM